MSSTQITIMQEPNNVSRNNVARAKVYYLE